MCDFTQGIKFCSCDNGKLKAQLKREALRIKRQQKKGGQPLTGVPKEFVWILYRFDGMKEVTEIGLYRMPSDDLGHGLNAEWIALNMNDHHCFDFDYAPAEGDNLLIRADEDLSPYLSFVFRNQAWVIDHHSPWSTETSQVGRGIVQPLGESH